MSSPRAGRQPSPRRTTWGRATRGLIAIAAIGAIAVAVSARVSGLDQRAQSTTSVDPVVLTAFVDSFMNASMASDKIPGAGFVFVQNGRVLMSRGYGLANVAQQRKVVPESTIWRIGSISKVFTATAMMQLVDRGAVNLDAPVETYVHRVGIPHTYPEPVTVRDLLRHTAGFDEVRPGTQAETRDAVLPLDQFLNNRLVRIRPPGRITAYSTYGITLAGEIIEEVSGMSFDNFMRRNIWEPLGMTRSGIDVPAPLQADVAMGYDIRGDSLVPQPWEWYHTTPASSMNATIADMGRFLIAHLPAARSGNARILSDSALREMHRQQMAMHPSVPGFALGFYEDYLGGLRVLEHGGDMAGFSALIVLIPSQNAGFFVVTHFEDNKLRNDLKWLLLQRLFPAAKQYHPVPATLPSVETVQPQRFVGRYIPLTSCFSCQPARASSLMTVTANEDGTLKVAGGRWIAVDSLRFVSASGSGYIVFRADSTGAVRELFAGGSWGWQKVQ